MVIWLTGLSGAGKTTIAEALVQLVRPKLGNVVLIDGDIIRELFGASLAFDEESRVIQISRCFVVSQKCFPQALRRYHGNIILNHVLQQGVVFGDRVFKAMDNRL